MTPDNLAGVTFFLDENSRFLFYTEQVEMELRVWEGVQTAEAIEYQGLMSELRLGAVWGTQR